MTQEEIISKMRTAVRKYAEEALNLHPDYVEKFARFGANIMAKKWDLIPGQYLSGFEDAIVNNDLFSTFAKADDDNRILVPYYVIMWNSMSFPTKELVV